MTEIAWIAVDRIRPSRHQRRRRFDEARLRGLAESIRMEGVIEPLIVREMEGGYELIAGERRWRAARLAQWEKVPARVLQVVSEGEANVKGMLTDLQRVALNPIEEAEALRDLNRTDGSYWNFERIAQVTGRDQAYLERAMKLLELPGDIQEDVRAGKLTRDQAIAIGRLPRELQPQIRSLLSDPQALRGSLETLALSSGDY
jgi:ParB family chromosome partitioning protein